jgi:hypothetical protein
LADSAHRDRRAPTPAPERAATRSEPARTEDPDALATRLSRRREGKQPRPSQPNRTGLPDGLKQGVETLSGVSLDDVKVHRNSAAPAKIDALAYTQGTDIHLGPGQEQHLPHETWHAAQQKQGRVKPTLQAKGVAINDDAGLEREADVEGLRALRVTAARDAAAPDANSTARGGRVAQAVKNAKGKRRGPMLSQTFKTRHVCDNSADEALAKFKARAKTVMTNTTAPESNWKTAINANNAELTGGVMNVTVDGYSTARVKVGDPVPAASNAITVGVKLEAYGDTKANAVHVQNQN